MSKLISSFWAEAWRRAAPPWKPLTGPKQNGLKVTLVDKAAVDRSGAVAMGLSAINQYVGLRDGANTLKDYVDYVRNDLMGVTREDLVGNIARHVDSTVHLFEKWGLPIWKDEKGAYVHEGRWQLMINGESYKVVVAEAAKNALLQNGVGQIFERVFIVGPLMDGDRCAGAIGFSVRENKVYVFKSKATLVAMGGAVHVFKPRSSGEGMGRAWYPPWNSGSSAYFTLKAGAEMTCQEVRFIPVRFKDAYGPVGAWFLLFKSRATNAMGGNYMVERKPELEKWGPYGRVKPVPGEPAQLPRHARHAGGQGPDLHADRRGHAEDRRAVQGRSQGLPEEDEGTGVRGLGRLPRHDDFAGHAVGCHQRAARAEELGNRRRRAVLHRFALRRFRRLGQRSGRPAERAETKSQYFWGYPNMSTVKGSVLRGRCVRRFEPQVLLRLACGRPHRRQVRDQVHRGKQYHAQVGPGCRGQADGGDAEAARDSSSRTRSSPATPRLNPNYIKPRAFMFRLQKIMDEYAGGVTAQFITNKAQLERALELLAFLKEDSDKLAAENLHELMRCWENVHRMWQAEAHVRTVLFRGETRWPGYYFRADLPKLDEEKWHVFANCRCDPKTGNWEMKTRPIHHVFA